MARAKVAIVHPQLGWGGSEAQVLWTLEALKHDYDVSLITGGGVADFDRLNQYYGTDLKPGEFSFIRAPMPLGLGNTLKFAGLRGHLLARFCHRLASRFDLIIGGYGPIECPARGIQYLPDVSFDAELRCRLDPVLGGWKRWWYAPTLLRKVYLKICESIAPSLTGRWKQNLTVAISKWTAKVTREAHGVEPRVIYPPVAGDFPAIPYDQRENGFVCIGRISPEKRMHTAIHILERVRRRGHDVHLHIVGGKGDRGYAHLLEGLRLKNPNWVFFEGRLFEQGKKDSMSRHRYGISARGHEAFGIGVAEMVKAGCIVFVPNGGGQVEIADHPALVYENEEDAAEKIDAVLSSTPLQASLRAHLLQSAQRFSVENYTRAIRGVVCEVLQGDGNQAPSPRMGAATASA